MDINSFFDTLHKVNPAAKSALVQTIKEIKYAKNQLIQPIGSSCRNVYFVKSGCARIFYYKDDNDITEHFAFENDIIVRAESLFSGNPTIKGIQAIETAILYAIDAHLLFNLYDAHHDLERLFRIIFEREYVSTIKRLESIQFKSAKERYLELLETTNLVQKIPLKYIASYLGITQVSLSRIRAEIG